MVQSMGLYYFFVFCFFLCFFLRFCFVFWQIHVVFCCCGSFQAFPLLLRPLGCILFIFLHHCLLCFDIVCTMSWFYSLCLGFFLCSWGVFMTDMYVIIFVVLFSAFCLLCCVVRFRVFVTLFTILPLCLSLYIQFLGETSDQYVLFCFFSFVSPGFCGVVFSLGAPLPVSYV